MEQVLLEAEDGHEEQLLATHLSCVSHLRWQLFIIKEYEL